MKDTTKNIFVYLWRRKGLVTSGVTLVATLVSGAFWVNGYFAKQETLKLHYCETQAALADLKLEIKISNEESSIEMTEDIIRMFRKFDGIKEDDQFLTHWKDVRSEHRNRLVELARRERAWNPRTIKQCMSQEVPYLDPGTSVDPIDFNN
jgi:hypothetical protein